LPLAEISFDAQYKDRAPTHGYAATREDRDGRIRQKLAGDS
jgi:hypothetical protein